jgi:transcriptional regulator with XRE-family HTH domain
MIGERIREARQAQSRSLADVAGKAKISVATLSRIENDKQSLELNLFLQLAKVLNVSANHLLGPGGEEEDDGVDPLTRRIAALGTRERSDLWRGLATERRGQRVRKRGDMRELAQHVEELVAQLDLLREELETVRKHVKRR